MKYLSIIKKPFDTFSTACCLMKKKLKSEEINNFNDIFKNSLSFLRDDAWHSRIIERKSFIICAWLSSKHNKNEIIF